MFELQSYIFGALSFLNDGWMIGRKMEYYKK